jgi:hypothetical protein
MYVPPTASVIQAPKPTYRIAVVGDSHCDATNATPGLETWPAILASQVHDAELFVASQGATGYAAPGTGNKTKYNSTDRIDALVDCDPQIIVVYSAINDDNRPTVGAEATAYFAALATRLPNTKIIVFSAWDAVTYMSSSARSDNIAAVKAAAAAAPNVLAYIDNNGPYWPATAHAAGTITAGAVVIYKGGVYRCLYTHTAISSMDYMQFQLLSWPTGTGSVGATAGDGNRDLFIDATDHPSQAAHKFIAARILYDVVRVLRLAA